MAFLLLHNYTDFIGLNIYNKISTAKNKSTLIIYLDSRKSYISIPFNISSILMSNFSTNIPGK